MRPGETEGVNYHFVTPEHFQQTISADQFLEHAVVFGNHYGTSKQTVDSLRADGRDVILEIDWQGADLVRQHLASRNADSGCLSIFIMPPSEETLLARLTQRGQDSEETIARRFAEAKLDLSQAPKYDYVVVNDDFDTATEDLLTILRAARLATSHQLSNNPDVRSVLQSV